MNLDHLRYFEAVARLQHYSRAAEQLHVTQPNLHYAITQLEQELGVPLFEKSGRRVRLTRYGTLFLESVTASLSSLDTGIRSLQELAQDGGLILVGSIAKLGSQLVPQLIHSYSSQHPEQHLQFQLRSESGFSSDLLQSVLDGNLDLAFTSRPGDPLLLETLAFERPPFVAVVPSDHPLSRLKRPVTLADLIPYPFVAFSARSGLRAAVDHLFFKADLSPHIAYETEEDLVIAGMVAEGFGISILPNDHLIGTMNLEVLPLDDPNAARTAYLSRKRAALHPEAADRFFQFCREALQAKPQI